MADNKKITGHIQAIDKESLQFQIEKQVEAIVWFQALSQLSKAMLLTKLLFVADELDSNGEKKIVIGNWTQAIGLLMEAIGITKELSAVDQEEIIKAQKTAISGDFFQSFGAQVSAIGGIEVIKEEQTGITKFVP